MEGPDKELFPNAARARDYGAVREWAVQPPSDVAVAAPAAEDSRSSTTRTSVPTDFKVTGEPAGDVSPNDADPDASDGLEPTDEAERSAPPNSLRSLAPPPAPLTTQPVQSPPLPVRDTAPADGRSDVVPVTQRATPQVASPGEQDQSAVSAGAGLVDRAPDIRRVARSGWRGRLNQLGLTLPASQDELRYRRDQARVLTTFTSTQSIVVASPKGGAGKTPTVFGLAATFGHYRGGYTLAWDNNETRGTLGLRTESGADGDRGNVVDLLRQIDHFLSTAASVGRLGAYVRSQSAHFDVLASDDTPGLMDMVDDAAYAKLREALGRFYRLMVVDTGNNVRARNWFAAVRSANCLVVPTTVQADVADTGLWMLDHLDKVGGGALVRNAVAVVTCANPHLDSGLLQHIVDAYQQSVRSVVVVPFDRSIQPGTRMSYRDLAEPTRRAYLSAAVAVIDSLAAVQPPLHGGGNR